MRIRSTTLRRGLVTAALAGLAASSQAAPDSAVALYAEGTGKVVPCFGCHGLNGQGVGEFPRLAGLPALYVAQQMAAYRDGRRPNRIMQVIASSLDGAEVRALAEYVENLSAPFSPRPAIDDALRARGSRLAALGDWSRGVPACADCHGPALRGGGPSLPALAGQPESYLLGQLEAFRSGVRPGGPLDLMARITAALDPEDLAAVAAYVAALPEGEATAVTGQAKVDWKTIPQDPDSFRPPPYGALPARTEDADAVLLGEKIFDDTPTHASSYVGNAMSCRNCHTDRGRNADSSPMWAAVPRYPQYRSKNQRVNTLEMRVQGCFRYSENGTPPPADSPEMVALITYMHWLADGMPIGARPRASGYARLTEPSTPPDRERGRTVYAASCAVCHGADGQGSVVAGARVIPPLWGPQSFNWGAGMHDVDKAAAFVYRNMPHGAAGALSEQEAWDVAAWIDSQPRPQDPRFTESVERTRELFHGNRQYDFYGDTFDGLTLGAPGTLEAWAKTHPPADTD